MIMTQNHQITKSLNRKMTMFVLVLLSALSAQAQVITQEMENRAKEIVAQMTLEEKIDYIGGDKEFYIRAIPRLGLPEIRMCDGPQGVRNDTQSTMYPSNVLTAATWNRELAYAVGRGMGRDCRARAVNILLAPGVNIYRSPLAGRSFEYSGEDPYLASEAALGFVRGVQDQGVMACVKHYAANNQEWDRYSVSSDVDERTMQEIYLPAFHKAVSEGNVASVMDGYNLVNGVWATENQWLNIDVLRNQFGFKGILMSDWGAVYDVQGPVNGGMDLEMPSGHYLNQQNLIPALKNGTIREEQIDLMCQHIIQTIIAFGWLNNPMKADDSIELDNKENALVALNDAREGIILLKNQNNALPLKGSVMVIGPNADVPVMGGGSGIVHPFHNVTLWDGMHAALGKKAALVEAREVFRTLPATCFQMDGKKGVKTEFFNNTDLSGAPVFTQQTDELNIVLNGSAPCEGLSFENYSDRTTTVFTPMIDGDAVFYVTGDDGYRLLIDGEEVCGDWGDHGITTREYVLKNAKAGHHYNVCVEHFQLGNGAVIQLAVKMMDEAYANDPEYFATFGKYDNVVVALGWNKNLELEGSDHDFTLPVEQLKLIKLASEHGKKVILVVNSGGNPDLASIEQYADAIVLAFYPGQEGGTALAEILTGKVNPSGKLPFTMERRWEDNPAYDSYFCKDPVNNHSRVQYKEGVFVGYRGYDRAGTDVLYPFGHGLSYTTFAYSDIKTEMAGKDKVKVTFTVKNTGKREGKEVCQVYVGDKECSVPRPLKELKGFEKISLKAGEAKTVSVTLDKDAFSFWDVHTHQFVVEPGDFEISVGGSSKNLPLKTVITL